METQVSTTSPSADSHHYRLVRYHYGDGSGFGLFHELLGENLSFEEAERLFDATTILAEEDLVIEDQNKVGVEAEIRVERVSQDGERTRYMRNTEKST